MSPAASDAAPPHSSFDASEEQFRLLVSSIKDYAIIMLDPAGRIVTWNEGAQRLTGYAAEEIIGQSLTGFYPPEAVAAEAPERLLALAVAEGRCADEGWRIRKDGSRFFADVVLTAMRGTSGELLGFAKVTRDITERKRAEEDLRLSEELLKRAQHLAGMGSDVRDPRTGERKWSDECYRIFGVSREDFVPTPQSVLALIHPDDHPLVIAQRDKMAAGVCPKPAEYRIVRPDGGVRYVFREWEFIEDPSGRRQMLGTVHDITERRHHEQQLHQSQKMEAIGELAGGMAHDFNNLLGIVIANLDLALEAAGSDTELRELLDDAITGALRGAELTHRLLAFARRQPLQPVQLDINELVGNTISLLSHLLGDDIEISTQFGDGVWPVIIDPAQLEASLANLASNARDAMPQGGRLIVTTGNRRLDADYAAEHPEVTPGEHAMIEITDTGTGIPPEELSRIFEPFFTTKEQGKGTGLGLSMVLGFMKQSGGHIWVYSEAGLGTTFRLYLPRAAVVAVEPEPPPRDATAEHGAGETVLVVEDNTALRRAVTRQLRQLGYRVLETERAEAALDVLASETVDLLFTDVVTPGALDGVQLARLAKERWPALRIVITSGFPQARIDSGGVAGLQLLGKPYRQDELAAALRAALSQ